jgi:hypothetical protein
MQYGFSLEMELPFKLYLRTRTRDGVKEKFRLGAGAGRYVKLV